MGPKEIHHVFVHVVPGTTLITVAGASTGAEDYIYGEPGICRGSRQAQSVQGSSGCIAHTLMWRLADTGATDAKWCGSMGTGRVQDLGEIRAGNWLDAWNKRVLIGICNRYGGNPTGALTIGLSNRMAYFSDAEQAPMRMEDITETWSVIDGSVNNPASGWDWDTARYTWAATAFANWKVAYVWMVPYITTDQYTNMAASKQAEFTVDILKEGADMAIGWGPASPNFAVRYIAQGSDTGIVYAPEEGHVFTVAGGSEMSIVWDGTGDNRLIDILLRNSANTSTVATLASSIRNEGRWTWDTSSASAGERTIRIETGGTSTQLALSGVFTMET